jgi:exo-beta-1,3-glucanase (GH17 family)/cellulose synthase/poly-beta-1,6-N-acetylglucosamine synthase-like glycosyltransferase
LRRGLRHPAGRSHMHKSSFIIAIAITALTVMTWALYNRPGTEPAWPERIQGFAFSPFQSHQAPIWSNYPSVEEIESDIALLEHKTHAIRTYTVEHTLGEIPRLAARHGINVALGAWVDANPDKTSNEITRMLDISVRSHNVVRIIVGNEVLLRGDIPVKQLITYLDMARTRTDIPVSTAEPPHIWKKHPELVRHVDYIAVHLLPYWEGIAVDEAVNHVVNNINELQQLYPGKRIVIGEVGWPSNGRTIKEAVASDSNEAIFLRRFLARAAVEKYTYYLMEAFDQPWKRETEGAVGAYWGVYDVDRNAKFQFTDPIVKIPEWPVLAGISVVIAVIIFALLLIDSRHLGARGRGFLALITYAAATAAVWIIYDYTHQYLTLINVIVGILLIVGMIGVIVVLLAEAHEWAEALWIKEHRRLFKPIEVSDEILPVVSVHVPAYNEPPDMMIETLDALAQLDYPRFEVIVVDNNTRDPAVWQPVREHCERLGARFHFFHEDPLPGFKAGALNFALRHTDPAAEIVAVIDSDYLVHPRWLRDLTPQLLQEKAAIMQAPQDYRDARENAFKAMCYAEYRGFFYIGMVTRNERNAIIQHGTMTLVRKSALQDVNGWAEWCITEDAELGLRIFEQGLEASYVPKSYGRGLMPDTFADYKKQRFRWAFGAVQIMRHHAGKLLFGSKGKLTAGQRYHFLAGWLPWLADGVNLLFNMAAVYWSLAMLAAPQYVAPPLLIFAILPLALFIFKIGKLIYLYHTRVGATTVQTLAAALTGLSLTHTIGLATLTGFVVASKPFFRTPKQAHKHALLKALGAAREEVLLCLSLCLAAFAIIQTFGTDTLDLLMWTIMLLLQAIPYAAAMIISVISALPGLPAGWIGETGSMQQAAHALLDAPAVADKQ